LSVAGIIAGSVIFFDELFSSSDCDDVLDEFKQRFIGHGVEHEFPIQNKKTTEIYGFNFFFLLENNIT
jgi:hypothetical protein